MHNPITGAHWTDSTLFSLVQDLLPLWDAEAGTLKSMFGLFLFSACIALSGRTGEAQEIIHVYDQFVQRVIALNLPQAIEEKPRLDVRLSVHSSVQRAHTLHSGERGLRDLGDQAWTICVDAAQLRDRMAA